MKTLRDALIAVIVVFVVVVGVLLAALIAVCVLWRRALL